MKFTLYAYFERHPLQKKIAKWWTARGFPLPETLKRHLANQIHAEMIARLMRVVVTRGSLDMQRALQSQYALGEEIAAQTADFLSINPNDARSLSRIIDFLHNLLGIHGKIEISASARSYLPLDEMSPRGAVARKPRCRRSILLPSLSGNV